MQTDLEHRLSECISWEQPAVGFVNMVMDRLNKAERDNEALQLRITQLEKTQMLHHHALGCTLHLVMDDGVSFSDGCQLFWNLGKPAEVAYETPKHHFVFAMNNHHANATAFVGRYKVVVSQPGNFRTVIRIGQMGEHTTVRQLVDAVNDIPEAKGQKMSHYVQSIALTRPENLFIAF